jgi:RNA polymerase sigma factor (sigma-70 family)
VPPVEDHAQLASDAELITRVRAGDRAAFGDLYTRHASAALSLARQFSRSPAEADDLVSEAFARVLDGMLESKGPDTAFRAYLFTTLRNTAYDRTRKDKRLQFSDDMERHDAAIEVDDPIIADLEKGLIGKAFAGLPERWQTVLWHLQVEGQSAAEVGVLLGMAPNAVSSLAFRAREGLREAYLQAHLAETAAERCRTTVDRLGAWTRGGLSKREKAQVDAHLEECDRCPALAAELTEINTGLRGLLAPLLLGSAAVGYLSTLGPVVPLAQLGVLTGGKVAAGLGGQAALGGKAAAAGGKGLAGHASAGMAKIGSFGPGPVVAAVAAAAAIVIAGVAIALNSGHSAPAIADTGSGVVTPVSSGPVAGGGAGGTANSGGGANGAGANGGGTNSRGANGTGTNGGANGAGTNGGGTNGGGTNGGATNGGANSGGANSGGTDSGGGANGASTNSGGANGGGNSTTATGGSGLPVPPISPLTFTAPVPGGGSGSTDSASPPSTPARTSAPGNGTSAPTTPVTSQTTTLPTTTTTTTAPPPPAAVIGVNIQGTTVSPNLSVGGSGEFSLQIDNTGDAASDAAGTVQITVPTGVTLGQPALAQAFRGSFGAFAAVTDTCSPAVDSTMTCILPAVGAAKTLTMTFAITAGPTAAASSSIEVKFPGSGPTSITVNVGTGYGPVSITSVNALGRASTGVATIDAAPLVEGADAGVLSLPLTIAPGITIKPPPSGSNNTGCSFSDIAMICPSGSANVGINVIVAVDKSAAAGPAPTAPATDQGGRRVATTGSLTVSPSSNGGYIDKDPVELVPAGVLAPGTTTTITLVGQPLPSVLDPGPIIIPVGLTDGPGVNIDVTQLPTGCVLTADATPATVTCSPSGDGGPVTFDLPVIIAPDATGGQLNSVVLPFPGDAPTPVTMGAGGTGSTLTVNPKATGYQTITARIDGLNAGSDGSLTLVGTPSTGITNPGKVTVPLSLGSGVSVTASANCTMTLTSAVCSPAAAVTTWKLSVHTASNALQATLKFPSLRLPGSTGLIPITTGSDLTVRAAATSCGPNAALPQGDFETPPVDPGAGKFQSSSTTAWNTTEPDQLIEFWRNGDGIAGANGGLEMTAESGEQWVELNANEASALYQDVQTLPGHEMRWTVWHRARALDGRDPAATTDTMAVQIGAAGASFTPDSSTTIADSASKWVEHTGVYIVPAGQTSTRFQFIAISTASGNNSVGNFLDNISFSTVPCLTTTTTVSNSNPDHASPQPGDVLTYLTTAKNVGGDRATDVTVANPAPANTTEVSGSRSPIVSVDPGKSVTLSFQVTVNADVPDGTVISNNAVVTYTWSPSTAPLSSLSNTVTSNARSPR